MSLSCRKLSAGRLQLNVAETNTDAPTLIMLHGVTRRWQTFMPIVAPLAMRHHLMLFDFRGHGDSDRAGTGYQVVDYVDDICRVIEEHITGPVSVYGHSLGAMTAAGVAARLGDRITSAVLEDPPLHTMGTRIGETPLLSYFTGVSTFAGDQRTAGQIASELGNVEFSDPASGDRFRVKDSRNDAQLRFAASCLQKLDPAVFDPILRAEWLVDYNVDEVFESLKCPALLLQADYAAGGMLTEKDAEHVTSLNANVARVKFDATPHGIHWTATAELLNTLLPFLESTR